MKILGYRFYVNIIIWEIFKYQGDYQESGETRNSSQFGV